MLMHELETVFNCTDYTRYMVLMMTRVKKLDIDAIPVVGMNLEIGISHPCKVDYIFCPKHVFYRTIIIIYSIYSTTASTDLHLLIRSNAHVIGAELSIELHALEELMAVPAPYAFLISFENSQFGIPVDKEVKVIFGITNTSNRSW